MLFVELRFFGFFLAVFSIYWSLGKNDSHKIWLLICSYIFYVAWNWKFVSLLMASSALDYVVGLMMTRSQTQRARRGWLHQP
jgi:alginate O-acetyltransferase complex protein AlgI